MLNITNDIVTCSYRAKSESELEKTSSGKVAEKQTSTGNC